jgi:hypothetical protein
MEVKVALPDLQDTAVATVANQIVKTQHKLLEESGFPRSEPLLTANPHRFVLFPIQDNEVRERVPLGGVKASGNRLTHVLCLDLENVQKGRSFLLDGRRD